MRPHSFPKARKIRASVRQLNEMRAVSKHHIKIKYRGEAEMSSALK
jgi:hypothetical protein